MIENPFEVLEQRLIRIEGLLKDLMENLKIPYQANQESDFFMDVKEASEFLRLSVPTIYGLVHQSVIPVNKKGKRLYFSKKELTSWIHTGRRKTLYEIKEEADNYLKRH